MKAEPLFAGIDVGTSGARAMAITADGRAVAKGQAAMAAFGSDHREPAVWWAAVEAALAEMKQVIDAGRVCAVAADGTSGTMLPVDETGRPLAAALMYNDATNNAGILGRIARAAPAESAAHGSTSGLARLLVFQDVAGVAKVIHQADWIAGKFSGSFATSDENNALKTGYDPVARRWPDWLAATGARVALLPDVVEPGTPVGVARSELGFAEGAIVAAGTTDGCASFLATGAGQEGDAVTALGTTLTVKMLCGRPLFAPAFGLYSHRFGDMWLAGGASNSGGNVLAHYFSAERIAALSEHIRTASETGLDYYPLVGKGERFPVNDPRMEPRVTPRPTDDAQFLQGLLEGMAAVEALCYARLAEMGAPALRSVRSVGGGARNAAWTAIRQRKLGVPLLPAAEEEAAAGAARLALKGARMAGLA